MQKKQLVVSLGGGLGNQLFQFAAAKSMSASHELFLETELLKPRKFKQNLSEIESFEFMDRLKLVRIPDRYNLKSQLAGYLLSRSVPGPRASSVRRFKLVLAHCIFSLLLFLSTRRIYRVIVSDDLGYIGKKIPKTNCWLLGYFQSYRYLTEESLSSIQELSPTKISERYLELEALVLSKRPTIVHLRLGDYLNEKSFGLPSPTYYQASMEYLLSNGVKRQFWIFSDDLDLARERLKDLEIENIRYIETVGLSSAEVLKIMSLGANFVIANSTFSYWAAALSTSPEKIVVAPESWFSKKSEPRDLIPENWVRINSMESN